MAEETLTTEQVREAFAAQRASLYVDDWAEQRDAFDRWLRHVQAEAWEVGYGSDEDVHTPRTNPYREER